MPIHIEAATFQYLSMLTSLLPINQTGTEDYGNKHDTPRRHSIGQMHIVIQY